MPNFQDPLTPFNPDDYITQPEDRLSGLESAKATKLDNAGLAPENVEWERVTLKGLYDLDSPRFEGVTGGVGGTADDGSVFDLTGKHTADRLANIDSYEVFPTTERTFKYQNEDKHGMAKMAHQRARLAQSRGVDASEITNEDVYEEGAKGLVKEAALIQAYYLNDPEYIEQVRNWEPSAELTKQWRTQAPDLSNFLSEGVEVERYTSDQYGYYGRPISMVRPVGSKYLLGAEGAGYDYQNTPVETPFDEEAFANNIARAQIEDAGYLERLGNAWKGFGATFLSELLLKPADALGDLTGLYDLGTGEELDATANSVFNYNAAATQMAMENIKKDWDVVSDSDASLGKRLRAAGNAILEAFTTPELFGTSFGAIGAWTAPGSALKLFGVGSKFAKTAARIDKAVDAGKFTKAQGKAKKLKAFMSTDGAKDFLVSQSGMITSSIGNVNQQYEEFVANNGGKELEGDDKLQFFVTRFGVQMVNQNLDKLIDLKILKSPGVLASIVPATKAMTNKEFSNVLTTLGKGVAQTAAKGGVEAAQEYAQTTMELVNSRYGSEMFKDAESFIDFLADERNTSEAGVAALAGAGGAGQFEVAGSILPAGAAAIKGGSKVATNLQERLARNVDKVTKAPTPVAPIPDTYDEDTIEEPAVPQEKQEKVVEKSTKTTNNVIKKYAAMLNTDEEELTSVLDAEDEKEAEALDLPKFKKALAGSAKEYKTTLEELEAAEAAVVARKGTKDESEADAIGLKILRQAKHTLYKNYMEDPEDIVLGSGFAPEDVIEEFLETAEVVDGKISKEDRDAVAAFSELNEIPEFRFQALIDARVAPPKKGEKDAKAVHDESVGDGKNSASSYRTKLRTLVNTPNASRKAVAGVLNRIDHFLQSQEVRLAAYKAVEDRLTKDMNNYNKQRAAGKKLPESELKRLVRRHEVEGYGYVQGRVNPDTKQLEIHPSSKNVSASISDTIGHLRRTKQRYGSKAHAILGDAYKSDKKGITVRPSAKHQTVRDMDQDYYDKHKATKVIVDVANSKGVWKEKGDYYKDNENYINTGDYSSDDVVVIHSTAKAVEAGSKFSKEIAAAVRAGATIIFDRDKTVRSNNKLRRVLTGRYHVKEVEVDGIKQYKVAAEADPIIEKAAETKAEKENKEKLINRAMHALALRASLGEMPLGQALKEGRITQKQLDKYHKALTEADPYFDGDREAMQRKYENTVKNQSKELTKELIQTLTAHGLESVELNNRIEKAAEDLDKKKIFPAAYEDALNNLDAEIDRLSEGSEFLQNWYDVAEKAKEGKEDLDQWLKDNLPSPKQITNRMFNLALGEGRGVAYTFVVNAKQGFKEATKNRNSIPADTPFQVLELDPGKYVTVNRITPFNSLSAEQLHSAGTDRLPVNYILDDSKELLKNTLETPNVMYKGEPVSITAISNSPATSLLYDKDLEPNENMAIAMRIGLYTFLRNSGYLLTKGKKTKADIAQILGIDESQLSRDAVKMMQDHGLLMKTVTDSIGKDVANMMGFARKSDTEADKQAYDAFVADLGQIAVAMGIREGLLEHDTSLSAAAFATTVLGKKEQFVDNTSEAKVAFIQVPKGKEESVAGLSDIAEQIESYIPGVNTLRKEPSRKPLPKKLIEKAISKIHKERLGLKVPEKAKKALRHLMNTEWTADLELMQDMLDNREKLKYELGYINISDDDPKYQKLSFEERGSQEAVNRGVDRSFDEMQRLVDSQAGEKTTSLWFKYYFSKNGRFFIDSNTLNPQTNKHLHRFAIQPASHTTEYRAQKVKGSKAPRFFSGTQNLTNEVYYALAQAFGFSTDKRDTDSIHKFATAVFEHINTPEELKEVKEAFIEEGSYKINEDIKLKVEHLGHALQGFKFLADYFASPDDFSSAITAEFDAVTSGFGLKLLQMPIVKDLEKWLKKVGIVQIGDEELKGANAISMNDLLDSGKLLDSYQDLSAGVTFDKDPDVAFDEMMAAANNDKKSRLVDTPYARKVWAALSAVLPQIGDDGEVSPELRNLFKYPFMTFNYSASIKSIRRNLLTGELIKGVASQIASADLTEDTPIRTFMEVFLGTTVDSKNGMKRLKELQNKVRTEPLYTIKKGNDKDAKSLDHHLQQLIEASYGAKVEAVLTKAFADFVDAQESINASFTAVFEVFFLSFEEKLEEARKKGPVTAAQEQEIYNELKAQWPVISGPLSSMEASIDGDADVDGVGIYDTETAAPLGIHSGRKPVRIALSGSMKETLGGQNSIRVSHMVKKMSAAIAAGSVVPIHYIDGSIMAETINDLAEDGVEGITAIHDAIMPPITGIHTGQQKYNQQVLELGTSYSFVNEILTTMDRILDVAPLENTKYKQRTVTYRVDGKPHEMPVAAYAYKARNDLARLVNKTNEGRDYLFNNMLKDGVHIMHMAGTPEGVHTVPAGGVNYTPVEKVEPRTYNSQEEIKQTMKDVDALAQHLTCKGS